MLQDLGRAIARDEPLLQVAHAICRWHHERWTAMATLTG